MIGKLSGIIDSVHDSNLILDVGGVGYVVQASRRTLSAVGHKGQPASLLIDTHVREDAITLVGFADALEQGWFRLLNSVQGVGIKAGLAILSACPADKISVIITSQDKAALQQAEGVGPKLAVRILTELKDRAENMDNSSSAKGKKYQDVIGIVSHETIDTDAVSALVNLGYGRAESYTAVLNARAKSNDNDLQSLIRISLKELSA